MIALWAVLNVGFVALVLLRLGRERRASSAVTAQVMLVRPVEAPFDLERLAIAAPVRARVVVVGPGYLDVGAWLPSDPTTANRKVGHLLAARTLLRDGEVFVYADADVVVDDALVADLAGAIEAGADVAVAAPRTIGGRGLAAAAWAGVLDQSAMSFVVQAALPGHAPVCGKAVALSRAALDRLASLTDVLAEDLALASVGRVVVVPTRARVLAARESSQRETHNERAALRTVHARLTRWLVALRTQRPFAFVALPAFIAPSLPLAVAAALMDDALTTAAVVLAIGARALLAARLTRRTLASRPFAWVLGEAMLLGAWASALTTSTITWRGRTYGVGAHGRLRSVP